MNPKQIAVGLQETLDRNPDITIDQLRELVYKYMCVSYNYDALAMRVYETTLYGHKDEMQTNTIVYKRAAFSKKYADAVLRVPNSMNITGSNATLSTDQKKSLIESGVLSVGPGTKGFNPGQSPQSVANNAGTQGFYGTPNPNSLNNYDARGKMQTNAAPNNANSNPPSPDLTAINVVNVVNICTNIIPTACVATIRTAMTISALLTVVNFLLYNTKNKICRPPVFIQPNLR